MNQAKDVLQLVTIEKYRIGFARMHTYSFPRIECGSEQIHLVIEEASS